MFGGFFFFCSKGKGKTQPPPQIPVCHPFKDVTKKKMFFVTVPAVQRKTGLSGRWQEYWRNIWRKHKGKMEKTPEVWLKIIGSQLPQRCQIHMDGSCPSSLRQSESIRLPHTTRLSSKKGDSAVCKKIKGTNQQYRVTKVNAIPKRSRSYNCKNISQKYGSSEEEVKWDRGLYVTSEIPSHLLGNRPKERVNRSITGSCLAAPLSMLVVI